MLYLSTRQMRVTVTLSTLWRQSSQGAFGNPVLTQHACYDKDMSMAHSLCCSPPFPLMREEMENSMDSSKEPLWILSIESPEDHCYTTHCFPIHKCLAYVLYIQPSLAPWCLFYILFSHGSLSSYKGINIEANSVFPLKINNTMLYFYLPAALCPYTTWSDTESF